MDSLTKIGFMGNKTEDLLLYLSRILLKLDKNIAVFDLSEEQLLKYSVPAMDQESHVVNYRNIDFYSLGNAIDNPDKKACEDYEIVLLNFGYSKPLVNDYMDCDHRFLVTDIEKHSILKLRDTLSSVDKQIAVHRVFRDIVDCKIGQHFIDNLLHSDLVENQSDFVFYLDEADLVCRLESQYNDHFKFNKLPRGYKQSLIEMVMLMGFEKRKAIKALKVAERGM